MALPSHCGISDAEQRRTAAQGRALQQHTRCSIDSTKLSLLRLRVSSKVEGPPGNLLEVAGSRR